MAGENPDESARAAEEAIPAAQGPTPPPRESAEDGMSGYYGLIVRPMTGNLTDEDLRSMTRQYAIKGAIFTVVGVVAILFPFLFGLAIEQLLAWVLVLGGGITLIQFLVHCGSPGTISCLLLGALHLAVGLWMLIRPIEGLVTLTIVLTGWLIGTGILKLVLTWQVRHLSSWPAVLVSGLISIGLGVFIAYLTPTYGLQLLGIVVGADLLSTGISVLLLSLVACIGKEEFFYKEPVKFISHIVMDGTGRHSILDAEQAREPLLQGSGGHAATSAA